MANKYFNSDHTVKDTNIFSNSASSSNDMILNYDTNDTKKNQKNSNDNELNSSNSIQDNNS